ncbi:hypothetical protein CTAYLR_005831 [Chrysophaeum taylorii]|uniref:K Homology domain-containing protein n=1 Tax=Chrysophaeum taylorii TaxID=2483200 RepID=A0AAD7UQE2_9STRA|nr:hypothetical protein CTAYLR_005831 [Chrysophaeum taylorii]
MIVIDGMNVALANVPRTCSSPEERRARAVQGLWLAVEYFSVRDVGGFKVFLPRGFFEDHAQDLEDLERAGVLFVTPGGLDDNFMISHADQHGAFIVSNDRFVDHSRDRGYDQAWLDYHRIPFMFDPTFAPDPDALLRIDEVARGKAPDAVAPRRARIRNDLPPPSARVNVTRVPLDAVGRVIGKAGATVRALEEDLNVKIDVDKKPATPDDSTVEVRVRSANADDRAAAIACIHQIVATKHLKAAQTTTTTSTATLNRSGHDRRGDFSVAMDLSEDA